MKGSLNGLRAKELTLITITIMCLTIVVWTWQKTPILGSIIPPQTRAQLLTEIPLAAPIVETLPSEPEAYEGEDEATFAGKITQIEEKRFDVIEAAPVRYTKVSPKSGEASSDVKSIPTESSARSTNLVEPVASANLAEQKPADHGEKQECNYSKGKWVIDHKRPFYSGFGCKRFLAASWSCRLTQRTDFAYESIRWQPKNCQMEEFEGLKFLRRLQDKTLAFVGDSLGRQQFQSLMCMITAGKENLDVVDVGKEFGIAPASADSRPSGWAYRFKITNTTVLFYWSASLCEIEPIGSKNPSTDYAMHLDRPAQFLTQFIHKINVLVLNTGHHWNRGKFKANRWVMYVRGAPNTDKKTQTMWKAKNITVHSIIHWANSQLPKYPGLKVFYRTISPRHFVGGEWNTGGSCDNTNPMSVGKEVLQDESSDHDAASAVKGTGVKLLDITALSQLRDEAHMSRFSLTAKPGMQDCLHWCLPGVPDTWNEILYAQI